MRNVDRFSYGRFDDGEAAVWAAGKAGWFEIQPSREYKSVYRDMVESIDVYYFVVDKYQPQRPAKSKQYTGSTEMLFAGVSFMRLKRLLNDKRVTLLMCCRYST